MTRLKQVKAREIIGVLKKFGFTEAGQTGSHRFFVDEKRNIQTSVPIHSGDIGRGLLKKILKQAGISEAEFCELL